MPPKGMALMMSMYYIIMFIVATIVPYLLASYVKIEGVFMIFAAFSAFVVINLSIFMRETKGLPKDDLEILYDNDYKFKNTKSEIFKSLNMSKHDLKNASSKNMMQEVDDYHKEKNK
jgi:hypothetical protein